MAKSGTCTFKVGSVTKKRLPCSISNAARAQLVQTKSAARPVTEVLWTFCNYDWHLRTVHRRSIRMNSPSLRMVCQPLRLAYSAGDGEGLDAMDMQGRRSLHGTDTGGAGAGARGDGIADVVQGGGIGERRGRRAVGR